MAGEKMVNYTAEMTAQMIEMYKAGETVDAIATAVGRTVRSVVAKLSREGVYQSKAKAEGVKRVTKAELVKRVEAKLGLAEGSLETLEKASHDQLESLEAAVA
jgi:transposase-like protein